MGDMSVDALLVELPVKLVCRRSQVRFLLTGFYAGWRGLHKVVSVALPGGLKTPGAINKQYNTMTETQNNDGQAIVACDSKKLKFSEIMQLMLNEEIEMDKPGILFAADEEDCLSWHEDEGANKHVTTIFRLSSSAINMLVRGLFNLDPKAWGTVGEWAAKAMQERAARKAMMKALEIENA